MARQTQREWNVAMGISQLAALALLPLLLVPSGREILKNISAFLLGGILVALVVGVLIFIIRKTERPPRSPSSLNVFSPKQDRPLRIALETLASRTKPEPTTHNPFSRTTLASPPKPELTTDALMKQLRRIDWFQFEKVVALAYRKSGYLVTRRGGANPDGGIDLIVEKDGMKSAIQCKHWKTWKVKVYQVREFLGALTDSGIQKGIFVTLCGYTGEAKQLAQKHGIEMVNEIGLAGMLESVDARFDPEVIRLLEDKRKFCPKCESEMRLRRAGKGQYAGTGFWGCSRYPRCQFMMPVS
jgi:HJR/Mrr/RecB family endonuclease